MRSVVDISELGLAEIDADVLVVGSGIAGTEVATGLARAGHDVVVLESGRMEFDPRFQALNDLEFRGKRHRAMDPEAAYHRYLPPEMRGVSRVRQLGGTSNVWTGKWKWFQQSDFPGRDWIPDSDWPIRLEDLVEHYRAAAADHGLGDLEAEAARPALARLRERLAGAELKISSFYWERSPLRARPRLLEAAKRQGNLRIITGSTASELELGGDLRTVRAVRCGGFGGRQLRARGGAVILAAGGIETPRLLLASDRQLPGGIGNGQDLVGRFYADHPKHHDADMAPGPLARQIAQELRYGPKPRFCLCFSLADALQARHRLMEHVIYLKPLYESRRDTAGRLLRGAAPLHDGLGKVRAYRVKLVTEQMPNRESRVMLSDRRDALGQRAAVLDWQLTATDERSLKRIVALASDRFLRAGLGRLGFDEAPPTLDVMTDAAHQMGTTRMADSPERGVVDRECRVFGTDNLYVAGSAVFPTGPSYSPTFTILALARRLVGTVDRRMARAKAAQVSAHR